MIDQEKNHLLPSPAVDAVIGTASLFELTLLALDYLDGTSGNTSFLITDEQLSGPNTGHVIAPEEARMLSVSPEFQSELEEEVLAQLSVMPFEVDLSSAEVTLRDVRTKEEQSLSPEISEFLHQFKVEAYFIQAYRLIQNQQERIVITYISPQQPNSSKLYLVEGTTLVELQTYDVNMFPINTVGEWFFYQTVRKINKDSLVTQLERVNLKTHVHTTMYEFQGYQATESHSQILADGSVLLAVEHGQKLIRIDATTLMPTEILHLSGKERIAKLVVNGDHVVVVQWNMSQAQCTLVRYSLQSDGQLQLTFQDQITDQNITRLEPIMATDGHFALQAQVMIGADFHTDIYVDHHDQLSLVTSGQNHEQALGWWESPNHQEPSPFLGLMALAALVFVGRRQRRRVKHSQSAETN